MEALVLTAYTTLCVIGVLVTSTILAGIGKKGIGKKRNQQRRPREDTRRSASVAFTATGA